jgi:hypothetical protein
VKLTGLDVMPTIRKPQHVQVRWLPSRFSSEVRSVSLKWSTDDIVTLTEQPGKVLCSIPASDFTRATLTTDHLRLYRGRRSYWLNLRAPTLYWEDGDTEYSYTHREKTQGAPDPLWWADQLKAAGVPVKVRGANWTFGAVGVLSLAIIVVVGVIAALATR